MVCSQSPKGVAFAIWTGWDDVADLDLAVGDDHAVDEEFEQRTLPIEVRRCQSLAHAFAERLGMGGQSGRFVLAPGVVRKVVFLAVKRGQPRFDVAPATLVFGQRQHAGKVGLREPFDLLGKRRPATAQVGPACLQFLREPVSAAGTLHRMRDHLRRGQHLAYVAPHQVFQRTGRNVARRAALARRQQPHLRLGPAKVVVVVRRQVAAGAATTAPAAADQAAQKILVHPVVPFGHAAIIGQPLLRAVELLLSNDGGHGGDRNPLGRVRDALGEPPRVSRRRFGVCYAAIGVSASAA